MYAFLPIWVSLSPLLFPPLPPWLCSPRITPPRTLQVRLFTTDEAVTVLVGRSVPLVLLAVVGYSTNTVVSGVLRGANRNEVGLAVNLITLWLVRDAERRQLCGW